MTQQDWRRDPIWQLLSIIIAIVVTLITQFNEPALKIVIIAAGVIVCGWIYFGNEQLKRLFKHPLAVSVLKVLRILLLLLLCATLFFVCIGLAAKADNLWEKIAAGAGSVLVFSAFVTVYHNERSFIAGVFKYTGFITGIVGIILVIVIDNSWLKIVLGIWAVLVEILTFAFFPDPAGGVRLPKVLQKKQESTGKS